MAADDLRLRDELAQSGALFDGYHPDMEALHIKNARALESMIDDLSGWPHSGIVGKDAADAAWLIAQHAISLPDFQRRVLALLQHNAADIAPAQIAMLTDRICCFEGKPQIYGTQFDWDAQGLLSPLPIIDAATVDARRATVGLNTLAARTAELRAQARAEGNTPPRDAAQRQIEKDSWAKKAGWKK